MELSYFDFLKKNDFIKDRLFIVTGDEPLQKNNIIGKIIESFRKNNFEISSYDLTEQNLDILYNETDSLSLFSMKRFIQFNFEKPPQKNLQVAITENILRDDGNIYLLVFGSMKKVNTSTKWFQNLTNKAIYIRIYQPNFTNAVNVINNELLALRLIITRPAIELLAEKTEGNLIAAKQILKLLAIQNTSTFNENSIRPFLHEHSNYDVFDLSDSLIRHQKTKSLKILNNILSEYDKSPLVLWCLKKELRILSQLKKTQSVYHQKIFKDNNIWKSKQKFYISFANKIDSITISRCLEICLDTDLSIKGVKKENIKLCLNEIVLQLLNFSFNSKELSD